MLRVGFDGLFEQAESGWFYDAENKYGTVFIKTQKTDVRLGLRFHVTIVVHGEEARKLHKARINMAANPFMGARHRHD